MNKISFLKNPIQGYAWGSKTFIPSLMGEPSPSDKPQAELWMGAHPKAPSRVLSDGAPVSLPELIRKYPEDILGRSISKKFSNTLPFLFKVLAAAKPLSIQAHPNMDQARQGFVMENSRKIPLNAPHRNYKDENHKPEIICALSPFFALKGFRKFEDIAELIGNIGQPALNKELIRSQRQPEKLKSFFNTLMTIEKDRQRRIITEVVEGCIENPRADPAFEWVMKLNKEYPGDIGVLSPLFLNVIQLQPGEALYIPAGEFHAYLEGAGIELMANSDNVLRGGLTPKHIDVLELLHILNFTPIETDILRPEKRAGGERFFPTPAEEFSLSLISVRKGSFFESPRKRSVEMMICVKGDARVTDPGHRDVLSLTKGASIIIPAGVKQYRIEGDATIYKAGTPL